jgi:hypothetical protein
MTFPTSKTSEKGVTHALRSLSESKIKEHKDLQAISQVSRDYFKGDDFSMFELQEEFAKYLIAQRGMKVLGDSSVNTEDFDPSGSIKKQFETYCAKIEFLPEIKQQFLLQEYFYASMKHYLIDEDRSLSNETTFSDFRQESLKHVEEFLLYYLKKTRSLDLDIQIKGDMNKNGVEFSELTPKGKEYYERERNKYALRVALDYVQNMRKGLCFTQVNAIDNRRKSFLINFDSLDYFKTFETYIKLNKSIKKNHLRLNLREKRYADKVKQNLDRFNANIENTKLICQISRDRNIPIDSVSPELIGQYKIEKEARKKKEETEALKTLLIEETRAQKKKKRKEKKATSSQEQTQELTIINESRPLKKEEGKKSSLEEPLLKYHPRVIRWSQITDNTLSKIKGFYDKEDRYASMDESQLRLQRDEHNLLGIHELFTSFQKLKRYSYAYTSKGNSCRGFYAKMIDSNQGTTRFGIISVGVDKVKNRIFHAKFDERTGLVESGKDLISPVEIEGDFSSSPKNKEWAVANKYGFENLSNGNVRLSYNTGISFEIVPL